MEPGREYRFEDLQAVRFHVLKTHRAANFSDRSNAERLASFLPAVSRLPLPKWYVRAKTIFILALTEPVLTFFHRPVPLGPEFRAPETLYETPEPRTGPAEVEGI